MNPRRSPRGGRELRAYVRQVGRVPPLAPDEEAVLVREHHRTRDPRLGRRLAEANLRLVIKIASKYARTSQVPLPELVQEGTIGLMQAVARFDPGRGVRFASYATFWIRAHVLKHVMDSARLVRVGRSRADRRNFFRGEVPPAELSLDLVRGDGEGARLRDDVADERCASPDRALERAQLASLLARQVRTLAGLLAPREAAILRERLLAEELRPLEELAARFAVSRERVRQIERSLEARLRRDLARALEPAAA